MYRSLPTKLRGKVAGRKTIFCYDNISKRMCLGLDFGINVVKGCSFQNLITDFNKYLKLESPDRSKEKVRQFAPATRILKLYFLQNQQSQELLANQSNYKLLMIMLSKYRRKTSTFLKTLTSHKKKKKYIFFSCCLISLSFRCFRCLHRTYFGYASTRFRQPGAETLNDNFFVLYFFIFSFRFFFSTNVLL